MGKDCVPKVDGYWLLKQKTFEKCGPFGEVNEHHSTRQDPCCVRKDCYLFCIEQCYRFVVAFYIPKKEDDPLEPLMDRPLIGVWDKEYDECGNFRQWVLYLVSSISNTTYKVYPIDYKKKCVKCAKYTAFSPVGNFDWFVPRPGTETGTIKDCNKCEDQFLPQSVAHGTAKRIKQHEVCKEIRKCECFDLRTFTRAIEDYMPCDSCC